MERNTHKTYYNGKKSQQTKSNKKKKLFIYSFTVGRKITDCLILPLWWLFFDVQSWANETNIFLVCLIQEWRLWYFLFVLLFAFSLEVIGDCPQPWYELYTYTSIFTLYSGALNAVLLNLWIFFFCRISHNLHIQSY